METKETHCHPKPAVNATCLLGEKGCYKNGKCHYIGNCEHKVLTNADRIRAMIDEELAVFVRAIIMAEDCPATGCDCDKCFFKELCFNGSKWLGKEKEWLKQPAE